MPGEDGRYDPNPSQLIPTTPHAPLTIMHTNPNAAPHSKDPACPDWYSACELSQSYSDFGDVADCLETDAGGELEECEARAQLDELSH